MTIPLAGHLDDERGLTLVEMMVAVLVLGIVLSAMASVIITSLTAMQRDEHRVRATQLGQQELERLRALEWDCVAFDTTDPDYVATFNGSPTVALDPAACSEPAIAPDPSPRVVTVDGIDYTVITHVYWIDDPEDDPPTGADSDPHDYKEFHVEVTWTLRGATYSYENTTTRVPTLEEVPPEAASAPATFEITSLQVDPLIVNTSTATGTDQAITVTVETSLAASLVTLTVAPPSTYGVANLSDISGGNGTRWRLTIPNVSTRFPVGDHDLTVTATSGLGTDTATQAVTFAQAGTTPVTVITPTLSPSASICVASNGRTHVPVTVTVDVSGVSTTDVVQISWTSRNSTTVATASGTTAAGARFTGTIPANHQFRNATTTLTIQARRISDNSVASGSFVAPVVTRLTGQ